MKLEFTLNNLMGVHTLQKSSDNQIYWFEINTQRYFKSGERRRYEVYDLFKINELQDIYKIYKTTHQVFKRQESFFHRRQPKSSSWENSISAPFKE
jgi:hypothetical protein